MFWLLLIIGILLVFVFVIRIIWLAQTLTSFVRLAQEYINLAKIPVDQQVRLLKLWPFYELLFNWAHWNIRYFCWYPGEMDEMIRYLLDNLLDTLEPEVQEKMNDYLDKHDSDDKYYKG